jgi:hypothetical protein
MIIAKSNFGRQSHREQVTHDDSKPDGTRPDDAEDARSWLESPATPAHSTPLNWAVCAGDDNQVIGYTGLNHIDATRRQAQISTTRPNASRPSLIRVQ